jgi:hypothetical protein
MKQSPQKVLDRILNYPNKEKGCSYICGPHLVAVRYGTRSRWRLRMSRMSPKTMLAPNGRTEVNVTR